MLATRWSSCVQGIFLLSMQQPWQRDFVGGTFTLNESPGLDSPSISWSQHIKAPRCSYTVASWESKIRTRGCDTISVHTVTQTVRSFDTGGGEIIVAVPGLQSDWFWVPNPLQVILPLASHVLCVLTSLCVCPWATLLHRMDGNNCISKLIEKPCGLMSGFITNFVQHVIPNPCFRSCSYNYISHDYSLPFVYCCSGQNPNSYAVNCTDWWEHKENTRCSVCYLTHG